MELLEGLKEGDLDAFETLFRQFQGDVYGWIMQVVRDRAIAEDLTIETFWRIYRARERFDTEGAFGAWARRVATNVAIDHIRSARNMEQLPEQLPSKETPDPAIQREIREKVERAFLRLSPKLRVAAILALVEERPYEEIASALGKPVGVIRTRVFRAVRQLRKQLERMGVTP